MVQSFDIVGVINPVVQAFPTPAPRKEREGRGTLFAGGASEIRNLGTRPFHCSPPVDSRADTNRFGLLGFGQ